MDTAFINELLTALKKIGGKIIKEREELFEILKDPIFDKDYEEAAEYKDWGALPQYKIPITSKSIFYRYKYGYLEAYTTIAKEIKSTHKKVLFYPYCFLFSHYLELLIKEFIINDLPGFNNSKLNHNLVKLYVENKENLINLGLPEKYFNIFIDELNRFQNLVTKEDISMCYKYPIDKDLKSSIIEKEVLLLPDKDIDETIDKNSTISCIANLIDALGQLARIKNYKLKCLNKLKNLSNS